MKLQCLIADDEPIARRLLQEYIADIDFLEWKGSVENALKAGAALNAGTIDLLFLDINMPRLSGIEFLRTATASSRPMVIMTTAYAEYATQGFELDVLDYLVKPFSFERFVKACNKARDYHELKTQQGGRNSVSGGNGAAAAWEEGQDDHFFVKTDGRIEKVLYQDLVLVEAMLNYVMLHTTRGKMIVYHTMKGILEQLPESLFLKVHKSSIVNLTKIKSITGNEIDLGSVKVTISQSAYEEAMKVILKNRMIKR